MTNTFSKWIDKKVSLPFTKGDQPLPTLPRDRPHVLTPSPSRENLVLSAAAATANSGFFQTLPPEIRRKILIEAFGYNTIHMHLNYDFPKTPLDVRQPEDLRHRHANMRPERHEPRPPLQNRFGIPRRKTWQWFSCICHRVHPSLSWQWRPTEHPKPCHDECCTERFNVQCQYWPGETNGKCFLGVMGWLLSCRQSSVPISELRVDQLCCYAEGIDILYSTNRIHMASSVMMRHLPQLLLPQRLSSITSVEMVWRKDPPDYRFDLPSSLDSFGIPAIHSLIDVLVSSMPSLRQLSLSLDCDITLEEWKADYAQDEHKPTISTPIDDMVRRIRSRLDECDISIPYPIYNKRHTRACQTNKAWAANKKSPEERIWRELPGIDVGDEPPPVNLGYWVCCGEQDMTILSCHVDTSLSIQSATLH